MPWRSTALVQKQKFRAVISDKLGAATAHVMTTGMVNAIARTIPTVSSNLAGFGFRAICPILVLLEGQSGEKSELLHTSPWLSPQKWNAAIPAIQNVTAIMKWSIQGSGRAPAIGR